MAKSNREREIERVEVALKRDLSRLVIKHARNLSYTEVHAAIIRTIEVIGFQSVAQILETAQILTERHKNHPHPNA